MRSAAPRTLVLVGGGHAHVQVLRRFAMDPPPDLRLLVVLDRPVAVYSGMVPGFVAGDYRQPELEIDVVPLARRAGAGVILSPAMDLDPVRHEVLFEERPALRFDLASIDVGSTVRGLDLPGVREHALSTRPIGRFVRELDARVDTLAALGRPVRVVVVGAGAAGTELAFTLDARLRERGAEPRLTVIAPESGLLGDADGRTRALIAREAADRGIETLADRRVVRVDPTGVFLREADAAIDAGEEQSVAADLVVWATGAAPVAFPADGGVARLHRDKHGFLEVRDTLQAVGFDDVFAAGDCARLVDHPWVPRAGVYAVRQGPVLERNLRARLAGRALRAYRPQRDFLSILNLGGGRALASKWGLAMAGRAVFRLKDGIDRRFMSKFQILDEHGAPRPELERLGAMGGDEDEEMACGGCAAKLGALPLEAALGALPASPHDSSVVLGLEARDDVAATRDDGLGTTLHNVDVIRAFCDDPWLVGRVAAANALSDLDAKGGRPRHAQAVLSVPELPPELAREILFQALAGLRATLDRRGVSLLGGHTTLGDALSVGLAVTGEGPDESELLRQSGARPGDELLLTRPLGTGVVLAADMQGLARGAWVEDAWAGMVATNEIAAGIARDQGARSATDVTGFGLAGHLLTLLRDGRLRARLERDAIPLLPGARDLWERGLRSTAHPANREAFEPEVSGASRSDDGWLYDPQTAGGLLLALAPGGLGSLTDAFVAAGEPPPVRIGRIEERAADRAPDSPDAGTPGAGTPGARIEIVDGS